MATTREVYLTGTGAYLPGEPLDNEEIARRLGCPDGAPRAARSRVLAANGIRTRHYAMDEYGQTTLLNEDLAAAAVTLALKDHTYLSNPDPTLQHYSAQRLKDSLATIPKNKLTGVPPTDDQLYGGTHDDGRQWYDVAASVYYYIAFKYSAFKALAAAQESYADGVPFARVINTVGSNGTATMYDPTVIRQGWQAWLAQNYG
jgi:hypothetical protein